MGVGVVTNLILTAAIFTNVFFVMVERKFTSFQLSNRATALPLRFGAVFTLAFAALALPYVSEVIGLIASLPNAALNLILPLLL